MDRYDSNNLHLVAQSYETSVGDLLTVGHLRWWPVPNNASQIVLFALDQAWTTVTSSQPVIQALRLFQSF